MFETVKTFNQSIDNLLRSTAMRQIFSTPVSAAAVTVVLMGLIFYFVLADSDNRIVMNAKNGIFSFVFLMIGMGLYHTVNARQAAETVRGPGVQAVLDDMRSGAHDTDYVPISGAFDWARPN